MNSPTFDYIVIGAGSTGCAVANRLSASGDASVLIVEAGGRSCLGRIGLPWLELGRGGGGF